MAQLLKPGMLNFEIEPENSIKIQPVTTGENGVQFQPATVESQPIFIEKAESELENLWATAKSNDDVYQSVVGAIKKGKRTLPTSLALKISIGDCSLDNNETLFFRGKK